MITDETYFAEERQIRAVFEVAGLTKPPEPNYERIEKIADRALLESIMKDSTSFVFLGFTSVITNFLSAFFGSVNTDDDNYKP